MAKRIKLGLIYSYNKDWVAGSYYILNLIHALKTLPDEEQPELFILSNSPEEYASVEETTGYPHLHFHQFDNADFQLSYSFFEKVLNRFSRVLTGKNRIIRFATNHSLKFELDVLFPAPMNNRFANVKTNLYWIPDFQECFLPEFFSEQEIQSRTWKNKTLAENALPVIFSSNDAQSHFRKLYPESRSRSFVLPFAVTHPAYEGLSIEQLKTKFSITRPYFFCANQFWAHKNHRVVMNALKLLRERNNKDVLVVFSGKESDYRNPDFFGDLKKFVEENALSDNVRFLGFIDREEQLQLMKHAIATVQPSLFEGWSTVVEDVKAMSRPIVVSDLAVHREQLQQYPADFFSPKDASALAELLAQKMGQLAPSIQLDYRPLVQQFGKRFVGIITQLQQTSR